MLSERAEMPRFTIQHPYIRIRPRHDRIVSEHKLVAGRRLTMRSNEKPDGRRSNAVASAAMENLTMEIAAIEPRWR